MTDITDHFPTVLTTRSNLSILCGSTKKVTYKRIHSDANIAKFQQRLSDVKWQEILDNNDANDDYNKFIETLIHCIMNVFHLRNVLITEKRNQSPRGSLKGYLKVLITRTSYINKIFTLQAKKDFRNSKRTKIN